MMHQCCISDVFYCFPDLADVFHFSPRYHFNNKIRLLTAQLVLLNVLFRAKSSSVSLTTPSSFSCFASEYFPIWHRSRRIKHFRRRCQTIPQQTIGWRNHGVRFLMPTLSIEKSCTALKSTLRSETKKIWSHLNLDKDDKNHAANDNYQQIDDCNDLKSIDGFTLVVQKAIQTLVESDVRRGEFAGNTHGSSSQGRWLYDPVAKELEDILDQIVVKPRQLHKNPIDYGNQCKWLRWMKSTPSPLFLDLTPYIHHMVTSNHINYYNNQNDKLENAWISSAHLQFIDMSLDQYLSRIPCHLILLPSGSETGPLSLIESTGAHIYGKLLYGGVTRYRILKSDGGKKIRRAGERREVMKQSSASATSLDSAQSYCHPSWVQLGGTARKYDALDIGPAAVLELTLLPRLWQDLPTVFDESVLMKESSGDMTLSNAALGWDPSIMLGILPKGRVDLTDENRSSYQSHANNAPENMYKTLAGKQRNDALKTHFQSRIGGLQPQINAIVRRVLDGRNVYSASNIDFDDGDDSMTKTKLEARELATLGIQPVRGLLLYGKSGTGKTLLAREISRVLSSRPPKIVSASELLDRWVGGSERCVRDLFEDAEEELRLCRSEDDEGVEFLNSALHVIVIDEIDAVFRKRIGAEDAGSRTRNSVVNQLLAKLDGVRALPNILMIGMTNRVELLDEALLRPGRFEVQVEVSLPDKDGRREILHIHFGPLRKNGRLSTPLCRAIDGIPMNGVAPVNADDDKQSGLLRSQLKSFTKQMFRPFLASMSIRAVDLADDEFTGGFSGADIAGLVRNAGSIALERARADGRGVEGLLVTLEDVECALKEMKS